MLMHCMLQTAQVHSPPVFLAEHYEQVMKLEDTSNIKILAFPWQLYFSNNYKNSLNKINLWVPTNRGTAKGGLRLIRLQATHLVQSRLTLAKPRHSTRIMFTVEDISPKTYTVHNKRELLAYAECQLASKCCCKFEPLQGANPGKIRESSRSFSR